MDKTLLSLCVFGAGLATANILILQRPTCPSGGAEVAAAYKAAPSTETEVAAQDTPSPKAAKPAQAPKAAAKQATPAPKDVKPTGSVKTQAPNGKALALQSGTAQAPKVAKPTPAPKNMEPTGSVDEKGKPQRASGEKAAPVAQAQWGDVRGRPAKVEDELEEWAEVSLAAKMHDAPSVSSPTLRYYRVGTRLKVTGRASGWFKVVDPTTSKEGWIYEKYLTLKEGPDQKLAAETPAQPEPYARSYRPRKHGWKLYRSWRPPIRLEFGFYPRW